MASRVNVLWLVSIIFLHICNVSLSIFYIILHDSYIVHLIICGLISVNTVGIYYYRKTPQKALYIVQIFSVMILLLLTVMKR